MILMYKGYKWFRRRQAERRAVLAITAVPGPQAVAVPVAPPARARRNPRNTGTVGLVLHQARYDLLDIWRNGEARFFTLVLPLLFLVIFVSVFGNQTVGHPGIKSSTYYVPGISAMAIIAASFVNLVISLTTQREIGVLKRRRSTPVPASVMLAGRTITAIVVSLAVMAVLLTVGAVFYGVHVNAAAIPAIAVTALLGSITFCVLGYALSTAIGSVDAAQPMVQAIMLPLYFISGVFIPNVSLPAWLQDVARIFPVQHLADGLHNAFDPTVHGSAFVGGDIASLLLWTGIGLVVALRRFSWMPAAAQA